MAGLSQSIELQLFSKTPLLITELEQDFSTLSRSLDGGVQTERHR